MGNTTGAVVGDDIETVASNEDNIKYILNKRFPINVVLSAPPEVDVDVVCRKIGGNTPLVYMTTGYTTDVDPAATVVDSSVKQTRVGQEEYAKRAQCRKLIQANEEANNERAREVAGSNSVMYEHMHRLMINYTLRHMITTPTTSVLLLPPDSQAQNRVSQLWRLYRTSVIDVMYGQMPAARHFKIIDEQQRTCLETLGDMAFLSMLMDCSPSNTVFVYVLPTERAYDRLVQDRMNQTTEEPRRTYIQKMMWQCYHQMKNLFEHGEFVRTYWTMVFSVDEIILTDDIISCIGSQLLAWIVARRQESLWGAPWERRSAYLQSNVSLVRRYVTVPVPQRGSALAIPPLHRPAVSSADFLADDEDKKHHMTALTPQNVRIARRTDRSGGTVLERTEIFALPQPGVAENKRVPQSSTADTVVFDQSLSASVMLSVVQNTEGFHPVTRRISSTTTAAISDASTVRPRDGWAARGVNFVGSGD